MKIFHKGKLLSPYGKGRKMEGRAKNNRILIARYKFDNSLYDLIPEFNEGFTYTYEDIIEDEVTTRTIYSDSLPTLMRYGKISDGSTNGNLVDNRTKSLSKILYMNISNLTDLSYMFRLCINLTSINCDWDINPINKSMREMFHSCESLTTLDLSNLDTSNVTRMDYIFYDCQSLTSLDVSNWNLSKIEDVNSMFYDCSNLTSISMNNSDYNSVNKVITELPERTADTTGALGILGVDDISKVDIEILNSEYWTIISHTILNNARLGQTKLN